MTYTHKTGVYALYLAAIVLAAVLYFALDGTDLCGNTPTSRYVVNLVCIAVTAAAVFVVVSWEKLGFVARQLQSPDESTVRRAFCAYGRFYAGAQLQRVGLLFGFLR